jgi:hypothetical protein
MNPQPSNSQGLQQALVNAGGAYLKSNEICKNYHNPSIRRDPSKLI